MKVTGLAVYGIWFISEILINRLTRSGNRVINKTDKNSLLLIWISIVVSITAAVFIAGNYFFPILASNWILYFGLFIILFGVVLRVVIIRTLGTFFTADVAIIKDHSLKTDGFYKYLRHPTYFASLLSFAGFGLSLNNWISFFVVLCSVLCAFAYRIKVEEVALVNHFGKQYLDYRKSTKGIVPFFY